MKIDGTKKYLAERIAHWYSDVAADYGTTGGFNGLEIADGSHLVVFHEEDGAQYRTLIPWFEEYTNEQIYNIWMEAGHMDDGIRWEKVA